MCDSYSVPQLYLYFTFCSVVNTFYAETVPANIRILQAVRQVIPDGRTSHREASRSGFRKFAKFTVLRPYCPGNDLAVLTFWRRHCMPRRAEPGNSKGQNSNEKVSQSAKPRIRITDDKNIRSHTRRSRSHNDLRYMYTNVDTLHNKKAELMTRILGAWELCETGLTINGYTSYSDLSRRGVSLYVKDNLRSNEVKTVSHIRSICVVFSTAY